tara:strand:- start:525 stop:1193 length:669 start_codon:yes stop_codon:yes gene_type:complete
MDKIYSASHFSFIDGIILRKRKEMLKIIKKTLEKYNVLSCIDVGTSSYEENESSNYIIKNLSHIPNIISISNQEIKNPLFKEKILKSITQNFSNDEFFKLKSDIVISNATIEHVGSFENQIKMVNNIINLSKKKFIIITPNRYHPIDFHTKIPFLHWLPKVIHRKILSLVGLNFYSREENLNLLSKADLIKIMNDLNFKNYKIFNIKLLGFVSNFILIGKIN